MKIALRIFLGYFLIVGLAAFFVMRVFVAEVKPGVRQTMEDTLVDTANALAELATPDFIAGHIGAGAFARAMDGLRARRIDADIWGFRKRTFDYRVYVVDVRGRVVYDSAGRDVGRDYSRWNDVYLTLRGGYGARSSEETPGDGRNTVMHVAAPIRDDGGRIVGALTVSKPNRTIQPFIDNSQREILEQGWVLLGISFAVGLLVAWWLSRALGRLTRYARAVSEGERAPRPPRGAGEIGELGRALHAMRERLEGKRYVERYVQALTHEMKSPLAAIRGAAELLDEPMPEPDHRRFVGNIREQGERLTQMIDKTLALAAVEYRQTLDQREPLDAVALAHEVTATLAPRAAQADVRIEVEAPEAPLQVVGDRFLLRQALLNLVENALEFSPRGGVVRLSFDLENGRLALRVRDQGPGVPDYARGRVFERFYSLPRPNGGGRSSGLGLSFVREVAGLHGGTAALENAAGGGAVATLALPIG